MHYLVKINGVEFGVFGHVSPLNISISVHWSEGIPELFASAVCIEDGERWMYEWCQHRIAASDTVEITETQRTDVVEPRLRRRMAA